MSKYGLNCFLDIIYCENKILNMYKILDLNTLKFISLNNNERKYITLYSINAEELEYIVHNICRSKFVQNLSNQNMIWIKTFEKKIFENSSIVYNNKLLFNYLILKLNSIGFTEEFSVSYSKFIISLLSNKIIFKEDILLLKKNIDKIYKNKEYFIINNMGYFKDLELTLLRKILNSKVNDTFNFDFKNFENDIIIQDQKSFARHCFDINKHLDFDLNKKYTLCLYNSLITEYLEEILNLENFQFDYVFLNKLITFLQSILNKVIKTWIY